MIGAHRTSRRTFPGAGLETLARAEYDALMRHRWWLRLPIDGAPLGPTIAWARGRLRCLASTRLPEALKCRSR